MANVFVSYRRVDVPQVAGRISDKLRGLLGAERVFQDLNTIPPGVDFRVSIAEAIARCDMMWVVIGKSWLAPGNDGRSRLFDLEDFVRVEIETALVKGVKIVPLLVEGATMPRVDQLPENIRDFAYRQIAEIRSDPHFHQDLDRLIGTLELGGSRSEANSDSSSITIEYDDDWITINGVSFGPAPLLKDITKLLGTPDVRKVDPAEVPEGGIPNPEVHPETIVQTRYWWSKLGIGAVSSPLVSSWGMYLPLKRSVAQGDDEPVDPERAPRIKSLTILVEDRNNLPTFQGTLRISGLEFRRGIKMHELVQMKSGLPLELSNGSFTQAALSGTHRIVEDLRSEKTPPLLPDPNPMSAYSNGCSLIAQSDEKQGWEKRPISTFTLNFEDYRHPCEKLVEALQAGEKIVTAVHTAELNDHRLDAMLTDRRLVIITNGAKPAAVDLSKKPKIVYEGPMIRPWRSANFQYIGQIILKGACVAAALSWVAWALTRYSRQLSEEGLISLWHSILRYGSLGLAFLLFLAGVVTIVTILASIGHSFGPHQRMTFRSLFKSLDVPEGVHMYHGSPTRLTIEGYNTLLAFADRLRCVVSKHSSSSDGPDAKNGHS